MRRDGVAASMKDGWKKRRQDQQQRERGDDDGREPRRHIVEGAVGVRAHHLAIIDEAQDGDEDDGQQQAVDDLRDDEHAYERQPRYDRDERARRYQKSEDADADGRFAETP